MSNYARRPFTERRSFPQALLAFAFGSLLILDPPSSPPPPPLPLLLLRLLSLKCFNLGQWAVTRRQCQCTGPPILLKQLTIFLFFTCCIYICKNNCHIQFFLEISTINDLSKHQKNYTEAEFIHLLLILQGILFLFATIEGFKVQSRNEIKNCGWRGWPRFFSAFKVHTT